MKTTSTTDFQYTVGRPLFRLPNWMRLAFWCFSLAVVAGLTFACVLFYDWSSSSQTVKDLSAVVAKQQALNTVNSSRIKTLEKNATQQQVWYPLFAPRFSVATLLSKTLEVVPATVSFADLNWTLGTKSWGDSTYQFTSESLARTKEEAADMLTGFRQDFIRTSQLQVVDNRSTALRQKPININGSDMRLLVSNEQWLLEAPSASLEDVTENMRRLSGKDEGK
jgi:hypothetical protein